MFIFTERTIKESFSEKESEPRKISLEVSDAPLRQSRLIMEIEKEAPLCPVAKRGCIDLNKQKFL